MTIAVSRYSLYTPFGTSPEQFWKKVSQGKSAITNVESFDTSSFYQHAAAEIKLPPESKFETIVTCLLERILEEGPLPDRTAFAFATTLGDVFHLEQQVPFSASPDTQHTGRILDRIRRTFGLNGLFSLHTTACTAFIAAMDWGTKVIREGYTDTCVVMAVDTISTFTFAGFSALRALTPDICKPFDQRRNGFILGDGGGCVVLTRRRHQETTYSTAGIGLANDGYHITAPHREGRGMVYAIQQALTAAAIDPSDISMINCHGTGSVYNDAMEDTALSTVFSEKPIPLVTAVKPQLGHAFSASSAIEIIFCLLSAQHRTVLPVTGTEEVDKTFTLQTTRRATPFEPRYVLKLSNAFGGNNAAILLKCNGDRS